jgi:NAD(P)-dependent dehydrogenase (short-subunit alcohol dehydrogenase family)
MLTNFPRPVRAIVFGASGGIGTALVAALGQDGNVAAVHAGSRSDVRVPHATATFAFDLADEHGIAAAAERGPFDLVIVATGALHGEGLQPEKSWSAQSADHYARAFTINATGPALIGKHLLDTLPRKGKAVFAVLSARVGSIGDNRLGGWHAYRASKAALNMIVRNFAIELARGRPEAIAVALHPGTVATPMTAPFRSPDQVTPPGEAASALLRVIDALTPADSGTVIDHRGDRVPF